MSEYIYAVNSLYTDFSEFAVQAIITKTFPAHAFLGEEEVCVYVCLSVCVLVEIPKVIVDSKNNSVCVCVCVCVSRYTKSSSRSVCVGEGVSVCC
jgi:hypothetical protein